MFSFRVGSDVCSDLSLDLGQRSKVGSSRFPRTWGLGSLSPSPKGPLGGRMDGGSADTIWTIDGERYGRPRPLCVAPRSPFS